MENHATAKLTGDFVHPAQVAGLFYPGASDELRQWIGSAAQRAVPPCINPKIAVIPHAGLRFSSHVAASAIAPWVARGDDIKRIVLIGPAHRYAFEGLALHPATEWETPLGRVPVADQSEALKHARFLPEAFEGEHAIELPLVMLQGLLHHPFEILPIIAGRGDLSSTVALLKALWGGPETVIAVSSDLSHFHRLEEATKLDRATAAKVETFSTQLSGQDACGFRPLAAAVQIAAERDLRPTTLHLTTSAEMTGDASRVVGYGAFGFEYAASARLPDAHRAMLLRILKAGLARAVQLGGRKPDLHIEGQLPPTLSTHRATFVTLQKGGRLRGCIGSLAPHLPLFEDVLANTVKAGFSDPRFGPMKAEELPELDVSISILSHPRPMVVSSEDELASTLEPDRDGLILRDGTKGALFLPSVWETIPDPHAFIRNLKAKAGLSTDHWSTTLVASRFRTESFGAGWEKIASE